MSADYLTPEQRAATPPEVLAMLDLQEVRLARMERAIRRPPTIGPFRRDEEDHITHTVDHPMMVMIIDNFAATLTEANARNYVAIEGHHETAGHIAVTIQRIGKETPHGARLKAEAALRRAVARLEALGETWDEAIDFAPDAPTSHPEREPSREWIRVDIDRVPNVLRCDRCGARQTMPLEGTPAVMGAMIDAFGVEHDGCAVEAP